MDRSGIRFVAQEPEESAVVVSRFRLGVDIRILVAGAALLQFDAVGHWRVVAIVQIRRLLLIRWIVNLFVVVDQDGRRGFNELEGFVVVFLSSTRVFKKKKEMKKKRVSRRSPLGSSVAVMA